MNNSVLKEQMPYINLKDIIPYFGSRHYKERKEFFFSAKLGDLDFKLSEMIRCESRHLLLTAYNCSLAIGSALLFLKGLENLIIK